jgi:hypothetical protein
MTQRNRAAGVPAQFFRRSLITDHQLPLNRRRFLRESSKVFSAAAAASAGFCGTRTCSGFLSESFTEPTQILPVAAVVTEYRVDSHADVILGKILEGYDQHGGPGPALKLVGLYTDQVPASDLSRDLAARFGFHIGSTIDDALTLGTDRLQVSGILSIGEHGNYPLTPDTKQRMYPRRRFFDAVTDVFKRVGQAVPVFNDKHLGYRWEDAKHMVDLASAMNFPLMAGSSLPVTWRHPAVSLPVGCEIENALAIGYGGAEDYGFHALEVLQCMVERRKDGETGVSSVRTLQGPEIQAALERGEWSMELFAAALQKMPGAPAPDLSRLADRAVFYQIIYRDGLHATIAMADGIADQFAFAAKLKDQPDPVAAWFRLEEARPFGHFGHLTQAIDFMIHTRRAPWPVERTLLTTGILDAVMHSMADDGRLQNTPELQIAYQPADWTFANRDIQE